MTDQFNQVLPIPQNKTSETELKFKTFARTFKFALQIYFSTAPWETILSFIAEIVLIAIPLLTSYTFKLLVDNVIANKTLDSTIPYFITIAGLITLLKLVQTFADYLSEKLLYKIGQYHINTILDHVGNLSATQLTDPIVKEKLIRISSIEVAIQQYFNILRQVLVKPIFIFTNLIIFANLSWWLTAILMVLIVVNTIIHIKYSNNPKSIHYIQSGYSAIAYQYTQAYESTYTEDRKVYRLNYYLKSRLTHIFDTFYKTLKKSTNKMRSLGLILGLLWVISELGNIYILISRFISGSITVGDITFYNSIFSRIKSKAQLFTYNMQNLSRFTFRPDETLDLLEMTPEDKPTNIKPPEEIDFKEIRFNNVSFKYPTGSTSVIQNLTTTIKKGEKLAVIGKNGAGKTTFILLLLGLYKPTSGEIQIVLKNGEIKNISDIDKADWYYSLNYISQNYVNYRLSVRENMGIGQYEKMGDDEAMIKALKKADIWNDLLKKANGDENKVLDLYLGLVFKGGKQLSGGQWQKIAIARSFMNMNGTLAVLDEPTSKLDAEAEENLFNKLLDETNKKTVVYISHRYSTVKDADRIILLGNGKIAEEGTHKELMKNDKYYAKMFRLQAKKYR